MTNEERKARDIFKYRFITDWQGDDPEGKRREMFIGNIIEDMTKALQSARNEAMDKCKQIVLEAERNKLCQINSQFVLNGEFRITALKEIAEAISKLMEENK